VHDYRIKKRILTFNSAHLGGLTLGPIYLARRLLKKRAMLLELVPAAAAAAATGVTRTLEDLARDGDSLSDTSGAI